MKFIGFWEYNLQDVDKVLEKFKKMTAEREKGTEKYPKLIFGPYHMGGESKGFTLFETDDMDQLTNTTIHYMPEMKWRFVGIQESSKTAELYRGFLMDSCSCEFG
jgi:muconolactone delta-isomerase